MLASPVLVNELAGIGIVTRQVGTRTKETSGEHALSWMVPSDVSAPKSWVMLLPLDGISRFQSNTIAAFALLLFCGTIGMSIPLSSADAAAQRSEFRYYPAFTAQRWRTSRSAIEAANDKGLVVEFIVRCQKGAGMLTYSKLENVYCSAKHECTASLDDSIRLVCR